MNSKNIITELKTLRNQHNIDGMARFGINPETALGITIPTLRKKAKAIGTNHLIAQELWESGIHEARILATMIDDSKKVTKTQMNNWVKEFNSWDICDQCCNNLFRKTAYAIEYSFEWANSNEEFVRRAGFVLMAVLSVHAKDMINDDFRKYFPIIIKHSEDDRNFVKKAVNWALRQIGKRNKTLNKKAIEVCEQLILSNSISGKWIGNDALRELSSVKIISRLKDG